MLVRSFLPKLATELGLRMIAPLPHGTFGAALVADRDGQEFVLKADPTNTWSARFTRGAQLAEELRLRGYPAPLHVATGFALDAAWSLQERLRGTAPQPLTEEHASRMVALARMHADAAPALEAIADADNATDGDHAALERLAARLDTSWIATELARVVDAGEDIVLQTGDIVHNDFCHHNVLVMDGELTGVIDWEQASTGDWRLDLATLAYRGALEPNLVAPEATTLISAALREVAPQPMRSLFFARLALRHLDLDARMRPQRLPALLQSIDANVAPWWRSSEAAQLR